MTVSIVTYRKGGKREVVAAVAAKGKAVFERHGAERFQLNQVISGADPGQWAMLINFKDWASFGTVMQAVNADAAFHAYMAEMEAASELVSRRILNSVD